MKKNTILASLTSRGFSLRFRNKKYSLSWPKEIWQKYSEKQALINNYVPLVTLSLPLLLNIKKIYYNLQKPAFQEKYKKLFLKDLPGSTQDNRQNALKLTQRFKNINYIFKKQKNSKTKNKKRKKEKTNKTKYKAIILLSFGKDSLLTLGVSREIGLNPVTIYINDTVSPKENKQKLSSGKKIAKEFKLKHHIIQNNIERLIDFDTWNKPETDFNYSHMVTGFCFLALPFVSYYNTKYTFIGSEQDMNFSFKSWQGLEAWPAYDQTAAWQKELNNMAKQLTNNTQVISIVRPLTNIAIVKILHKRYPEIAKYQLSCDCLDASRKRRWCHECNKCARLFLFMRAFGINTKKLGLKNMFEKKHKKFYSLFDGKEVDRYEKSPEAREQQLLAFLLATRKGSKGKLIDYFKRNYLKEAKEKEDKLRKKYFKLWPANIPKKLRTKILSIYKEELKELR